MGLNDVARADALANVIYTEIIFVLYENLYVLGVEWGLRVY